MKTTARNLRMKIYENKILQKSSTKPQHKAMKFQDNNTNNVPIFHLNTNEEVLYCTINVRLPLRRVEVLSMQADLMLCLYTLIFTQGTIDIISNLHWNMAWLGIYTKYTDL